MKMKESHEDVFVTDENIVRISKSHVDKLKDALRKSGRKRVRFCAHSNNDHPVHEMLIVLSHDTYIRPHQHRGKSESFHVVEGKADIIFFDEQGNVKHTVELNDYSSGKIFFYRIEKALFHTVIIHSETFIIHETTKGPFSENETDFAPWSPPEENISAAEEYMRQLRSELTNYSKH